MAVCFHELQNTPETPDTPDVPELGLEHVRGVRGVRGILEFTKIYGFELGLEHRPPHMAQLAKPTPTAFVILQPPVGR